MTLSNIPYYIIFAIVICALTVIRTDKNIGNIALVFNDTGVGWLHVEI